MNKRIAILGYGHMGKALEKGLVSSGIKKDQISTANSSQENRKAIEKVDWIFITVKPVIAKAVLEELKEAISDKIIISAAAGVSISKIAALTSKDQKVIRIMPNLPVACNEGVIGLFANKAVSFAEKRDVVSVLSGLGSVIDCTSENDLEVVTVLAGCGPGVVSYLMTMLTKSGMTLGLSKDASQRLAMQTFKGTLAYLHETNQSARELQDAVATKGGVTEAIIKDLDAQKIQAIFDTSLGKGYDKIKKLKAEL